MTAGPMPPMTAAEKCVVSGGLVLLSCAAALWCGHREERRTPGPTGPGSYEFRGVIELSGGGLDIPGVRSSIGMPRRHPPVYETHDGLLAVETGDVDWLRKWWPEVEGDPRGRLWVFRDAGEPAFGTWRLAMPDSESEKTSDGERDVD